MNRSLIASSNILINASPEKIWDVLTDPEKIKIYLYDTNVQTDWKKGSPINFEGKYEGKQYNDKGKVIENIPFKLLKYNYWSSLSGLEDKEENHSIVTYTIEPVNENVCQFTWHQQGFSNEEGKCHTEEGLKTMLNQVKEFATSLKQE
jgi:uncharacterized protein YndB with AHSA1/START domain